MIPNLSSLPQSVPLKYLFTLSISTLYNLYHVLYTVQRCMYPIYHLYSVHCIVYLFTQLTTCTVYCTQFSRGPTVQLVQYSFVHALKSVQCSTPLRGLNSVQCKFKYVRCPFYTKNLSKYLIIIKNQLKWVAGFKSKIYFTYDKLF